MTRPASHRRVHRRTLAAGMALALLLFAAAPTVWHALRAADAASWVQVCSKDGVVRAQYAPDGHDLPNPAQPVVPAVALHGALPGHDLGLPGPPSAHAVAPDARLCFSLSHATLAPPCNVLPWRAAHARAPTTTRLIQASRPPTGGPAGRHPFPIAPLAFSRRWPRRQHGRRTTPFKDSIMNDLPFNRRHWLATASVSTLALGTGCATQPDAASPGMAPTAWTDKFGLVAALPKDTSPLTNELAKYPRCRYCGMERDKFSHTRHLLVYEDDTVEGTCSIHCAAISLSLNMDRGPKAIYAGDAGAAVPKDTPKPLALVDQMHYVIDPSKTGTMTKVSKFAYADRAAADAAAGGEAAAKAGAKVVDFNTALTGAYLGMADDTIMLRKRRGEMRKKMMVSKPAA